MTNRKTDMRGARGQRKTFKTSMSSLLVLCLYHRQYIKVSISLMYRTLYLFSFSRPQREQEGGVGEIRKAGGGREGEGHKSLTFPEIIGSL